MPKKRLIGIVKLSDDNIVHRLLRMHVTNLTQPELTQPNLLPSQLTSLGGKFVTGE
jgi:hypothetical protein